MSAVVVAYANGSDLYHFACVGRAHNVVLDALDALANRDEWPLAPVLDSEVTDELCEWCRSPILAPTNSMERAS